MNFNILYYYYENAAKRRIARRRFLEEEELRKEKNEKPDESFCDKVNHRPDRVLLQEKKCTKNSKTL
jgi:hypothetical protein